MPFLVGAVRLVDGRPYSGRAEAFVDGHWGTICDGKAVVASGWPTAFCKDLGYVEARNPRTVIKAGLSPGTGSIAYLQMGCDGSQAESLSDCHLTGETCTHQEDIAVDCTNTCFRQCPIP